MIIASRNDDSIISYPVGGAKLKVQLQPKGTSVVS